MKYVVMIATPNPDDPKRIMIVEGADAPAVKAAVVKTTKLSAGEDVEVREFDPIADAELEANLAKTAREAAEAQASAPNGRSSKG